MSNPLAVRKLFSFWPCVPPIILCALAFSHKSSGPAAITDDGAFKVAGVLSLRDTMVTGRAAVTMLHGQLRPSVQVRGEAPLGGRVMQVLVKPGQRVRVGDPVLQLAGQTAAPGSAVAMRQQNVAESAQVDAAHQQEILQKKLADRQEKLLDAQERVRVAQERVAQAKEAVRRTARGQSVSRVELAALGALQLRPRLAARGAHQRTDAELAALRKAETDSAAQADEASAKADKARDAAIKLGEDAIRLKNKLRDAQSAAAKSDDRAAKAQAKPGEVEAAHTAMKAAQQAAQEAITAAETARAGASRLDGDAEKLRVAVARVTSEIQKRTIVEPTPAAVAGSNMSANDVSLLAETALRESEDAAGDAEKLQHEITEYSRQVRQLNDALSSTSTHLENAQMAVVESKIAEKLEAVRAPATGVVLQVAATSLVVTQGETIIAIGANDRLEIRLIDESQSWQTLQPGALLPATVLLDGEAVAVEAEVREICAPLQTQPATIIATIENPLTPAGTRRFATGLPVECIVSAKADGEVITVPVSAIINENKLVQAAVLIPTGEPSALLFRVEWRNVTTTGTGPLCTIAGGLKSSERIALHPEALRALLKSPSADSVVRLTG